MPYSRKEIEEMLMKLIDISEKPEPKENATDKEVYEYAYQRNLSDLQAIDIIRQLLDRVKELEEMKNSGLSHHDGIVPLQSI